MAGRTAPLIVSSPLGVDQRPISGKLRLIFDARFPNLWHAYESFHYEITTRSRIFLSTPKRVVLLPLRISKPATTLF